MDFNTVIELEKNLLDSAIRKDSTIVDHLLDDSFIEFGTSGRIYDKKIIIERLYEENPVVVEAYDLAPVQLAPDIIQLRFKTRRKNEDGSLTASLRSSIWKKTSQSWKMIFHQGTRTTP
ncbi:MAG: DUF4440 domain-containing protein [Bdellovibrionota bacterium]